MTCTPTLEDCKRQVVQVMLQVSEGSWLLHAAAVFQFWDVFGAWVEG